MRITGFHWLQNIIEKLIVKHSVSPDEVEQLFENEPKFRFVERGTRDDENVYSATGQTNGGRFLIVFFIHKIDSKALILSARDMEPKERKRHERK